MADEELKKQMALFRFSLIAPVVAGTYQEASKIAYFRVAADKDYTLPNGQVAKFAATTLKAWYLSYMAGGLDALIPRSRIDLGKSRTLSGDVCRQILAYRDRKSVV